MLVCRDTSKGAAFCLLFSEQEPCWLQCTAGLQGASSHPHLARRELDMGTCGLHITTTVRDGTGASACTSAQELIGALDTQVTWRRIHPAKPRWAAGWQLPPGHTAKESSASPVSQERHRALLLSSLCLARALEISL